MGTSRNCFSLQSSNFRSVRFVQTRRTELRAIQVERIGNHPCLSWCLSFSSPVLLFFILNSRSSHHGCHVPGSRWILQRTLFWAFFCASRSENGCRNAFAKGLNCWFVFVQIVKRMVFRLNGSTQALYGISFSLGV